MAQALPQYKVDLFVLASISEGELKCLTLVKDRLINEHGEVKQEIYRVEL